MSSNIKVDRICEYCGKTFTARTTVTRFCSHSCSSRSHKDKIKRLKMAASNGETIAKLTRPIEALKAKDFLSIHEACELLGISRMTLHRQIKSGKIKPGNIGRRIIISRTELDKLVA